MSSVNKVILVGNMGRDPEIRHTQNGDPVAHLSIATSESWKDRQSGERRERTEWHRVVIFNEHLARIAEQYLRKGSKVYLEGQLQTRKWTDQYGMEKYTTEIVLQRYRGEIVMLDSKSSVPPPAEALDDYGHTSTKKAGEFTPADYQRAKSGDNPPAPTDLDDDIPF